MCSCVLMKPITTIREGNNLPPRKIRDRGFLSSNPFVSVTVGKIPLCKIYRTVLPYKVSIRIDIHGQTFPNRIPPRLSLPIPTFYQIIRKPTII